MNATVSLGWNSATPGNLFMLGWLPEVGDTGGGSPAAPAPAARRRVYTVPLKGVQDEEEAVIIALALAVSFLT